MEKEKEEEANLKSFFSWAAELGISDSSSSTTQSENATFLGHSLFISHFPEAGGRGLAAARNLIKGELILKVPKESLMTSDSLMTKDPPLSFALKKHPSLSSTQILSIALLNEVNKGKNSWWYPYLKQIPRSYDTLATFNQLEIQALQIDDAIWVAEKALKKAELDWEKARPILNELKLKPRVCTFKAWLWACATISSRTMHISWDEAGCLCPVGDLFNYAVPEEDTLNSNTERLIDAGYEENVASYCFYARTNYKKGEQVLLSYGTYTNLELLEHYGFLLKENQNDKAFIPFKPDMYSLCSCSWPRDSLYIHQDGKLSFALLCMLRLWAINVKERRVMSHVVYSGQRVSVENEVTCMKWLMKHCGEILESFETLVEEDELLLRIIEKLLEDGEINEKKEILGYLMDRKSIYRLRLAIEWRVNYKRTLMECIKHCSVVIKDNS